jgi:hypothetical protein
LILGRLSNSRVVSNHLIDSPATRHCNQSAGGNATNEARKRETEREGIIVTLTVAIARFHHFLEVPQGIPFAGPDWLCSDFQLRGF